MLARNYLNARSFALDLGNNNTLLSFGDRILLSEPSFVVFDSSTQRVKAVGDKAYDMFEKSHGELKPVKPLKRGVIADYDSAFVMIREMVKKAFEGRRPWAGYREIVSGVPHGTTEVEKRALREALDQFNASKMYLLPEPLAAAMGMGINIREPEGKMVVDIGGGITEIVIISLSGIAVFQSIEIAGDTLTESIQDCLRKNYNLQVGWKTAEHVKMGVGAALEKIPAPPPSMVVRGKDIMQGLPVQRMIGHAEVARMLDPCLQAIESHIVNALEVCPPELASDIYDNGIHLTGGGSLLRGLKSRLEKVVQLPVHLDPEPLLSVSKGISLVLRDTTRHKSILLN